MPAKEIKELRQSGKLDEAYIMAKNELDADTDNIWCKRNISWVLYAQLDKCAENTDAFIDKMNEVKALNLPETEDLFYENISIVIAKAARKICSQQTINVSALFKLFDEIKTVPVRKVTKWYSVLFKAFHKGMKETNRYIEFADWWGFNNFTQEDFVKESLPNGKPIMSLAEQAYIAYAKHLLPVHTQYGETIFDKEKVHEFLPILTEIVEKYPDFQYPAYFNAKLLLALGDSKDGLSSLLPFAKRKKNDFWVWDVFADAFATEPETVFSCYCRALVCNSPEEMLVNVRQKLAKLLIGKKQYNEAKTEIELLIKARTEHSYKISNEIIEWQNQDWYKNAKYYKSNAELYKQYAPIAEGILYSDNPEELIFVEFVNTDRKILNFIGSGMKYGFLKYERLIKEIKVGDILKVRIQGGTIGGAYQLYTAVRVNDEEFKKQFIKDIEGIVRIKQGNSFGFIDDVFIHPSVIAKLKLTDGMSIKGKAVRTYNSDKKQWGWKFI